MTDPASQLAELLSQYHARAGNLARVTLMSPSRQERRAIAIAGSALVASLVAILGLMPVTSDGLAMNIAISVLTIASVVFVTLMIMYGLRATLHDEVLQVRRLHTQTVSLAHLRSVRIRVRHFSLRTKGYAIRLSDTSDGHVRVWAWALRAETLMKAIKTATDTSGVEVDPMTATILDGA